MRGRNRNGLGLLPQAFFVAISLGTASGCGDDRSPKVPVRGQVYYQGKPLEYGSVMFQPLGGGEIARGTIGTDGTFVLTTTTTGDGVQVGRCRVRVTAFEAQRTGGPDPTRQELPLGGSAIPDRYQSFGTSQIVIDVNPEMPQPVKIVLE
jgi:hypothetical protein